MKKVFKKLIFLLFAISIIYSTFCYAKSLDDNMLGSKKLKDFSNASIGSMLGSINDTIVKKALPDAKIKIFNNLSDILVNLRSYKIDGCALEFTTYCEIYRGDNNYKMIEDNLAYLPQAYILSKKICEEDDGRIQKELNEFFVERNKTGWLQEVEDKWILNNVSSVQYEKKVAANPKRTLTVAFTPYVPYTFVKNQEVAGMDVEIIEAFAEEYNYKIKYENVEFLSELAGVSTGKYDIGIGGITITDERKESVIFSDAYYNDKMVLVYYEKNNNPILFFENIKNSFIKSFIIEERYKIVFDGIINTILITIFSIFGGIIIGILIYLLYRKNIIVINKIIDMVTYVINGMPFLVLLLVLYYVIFSKVNISGIVVSIIAFILSFGIYVFTSILSSISIIDKGQKEAACALGYTDIDIFKKVLFPQVILLMYPGFKSQVITLLKETSIVGYIAVTDLTRAGDLIRSRTYEAFFPIISIAIIYFILGILFKLILNFIGDKLNPKNRKKENILKGVAYDRD